MARQALAHRRATLPGDILNVSRIEYETACDQIVTNRRRFERNELRITALEQEVATLKKLLRVAPPARSPRG